MQIKQVEVAILIIRQVKTLEWKALIVKVLKNKERLSNCHRLEEIWWLNAMWDPGLEPGTEKKGKIWIKSDV